MEKSVFDEFIGQYSLSKTLCFELRPVGETEARIRDKRVKGLPLLEYDERLAADYKKAKKILDEYHKEFIENSLRGVELSGLETFCEAYQAVKKDNKDGAAKERLKKEQNRLCKEIAGNFETGNLLKGEFVKKELPGWVEKRYGGEEREEKRAVLAELKNFTTYFTGFNENRKNVYTDKEHSTGIAFRLIHDNLPKFIDNGEAWQRIAAMDKADVLEPLRQRVELAFHRSLEEFFQTETFNQCLAQSGIDAYNDILGGRFSSGKSQKEQGVNELINLYNQKQKDKKERLPRMQPLFKQILSDREGRSFVPEAIADDRELVESIGRFYREGLLHFTPEHGDGAVNYLAELQKTLASLPEADAEKIHIRNDRSLTDISAALFGDWRIIGNALQREAERQYPPTGKSLTKTTLEKRDKWARNTKYFSLAFLNKVVGDYANTLPRESDERAGTSLLAPDTDFFASKQPLSDYLARCRVKTGEKTWDDPFKRIETAFQKTESLLDASQYEAGQSQLMGDKGKVEQIKNFLDALQALLHFLKLLFIEIRGRDEDKQSEAYQKDSGFYSDFDLCYRQLAGIIPLYNKCRNYLTRKPYSTEKYKLNFENVSLACGWDKNKEIANTTVLLKKNDCFYLAVMDKKHNRLFADYQEEAGSDFYEKIEYKLLPGANKMLPKVFFSNKNIGFYQPSQSVLDIRNRSSHTKNGSPQKGYRKADFNLADCHQIIDFFKASIAKHPDWKSFGFEFSSTKDYKSIDSFYRDIHEGTSKNV